jgi:hypothetical protein
MGAGKQITEKQAIEKLGAVLDLGMSKDYMDVFYIKRVDAYYLYIFNENNELIQVVASFNSVLPTISETTQMLFTHIKNPVVVNTLSLNDGNSAVLFEGFTAVLLFDKVQTMNIKTYSVRDNRYDCDPDYIAEHGKCKE